MNILLILNAKGDISKNKTFFFLTTHTQKALLKYYTPLWCKKVELEKQDTKDEQ